MSETTSSFGDGDGVETPASTVSGTGIEGLSIAPKDDEKNEAKVVGEDNKPISDQNESHTAVEFLMKQSSIYVSIISEQLKRYRAKELAKGGEPQTSTSTSTAATTTNGKGNKKTKGKGKAKAKKGGAKNATIDSFFGNTAGPVGAAATSAALAAAASDNDGEKLGQHKELRSARQPKLITGGIMKDYQLEGLEWLITLYENGLNGILADEMGLGKTLQTISFLAFLREKGIKGPFLVVGPVSVLSSWVDEIARWAPDMPALLYHGNPKERAELRRTHMSKNLIASGEFPIICTNYEMIIRDKPVLSQYQWKYVIIDEGHRLKNMNCKLVKELKTYTSSNRLLLTGTPLQNNLLELWSLLNFLIPEIFDDFSHFENYFDFSKIQDKDKAAHAAFMKENEETNLVGSLHALLKPFLLRRVKTDVETDLPPKKEYILYAPLSPLQKGLYGALLEHRAVEFLTDLILNKDKVTYDSSTKKRKLVEGQNGSTPKKTKTESSVLVEGKRTRKAVCYREDVPFSEWYTAFEKEGNASTEEDEVVPEMSEHQKAVMTSLREVGNKKLQNMIMQLRLVCNTPHHFFWPFHDKPVPDKTLVTSSGKMMLLERLVPALIERGHKILIFSQFKAMLDIIHDWAELLHGWEVCRLDGAVAQVDRRAAIKRFNTAESAKLFLLTTRAGGLGINLTSSDTVILFDSDWNPQMDLQAQDRAHRIGQTKPVVIYRFATANTVEQTLLDKADGKRRLEKLIIQKGKFKSFSKDASKDDAEALDSLILKEDFEKVTVVEEGDQILSDAELEALLDRSPEAFAKDAVESKALKVV